MVLHSQKRPKTQEVTDPSALLSLLRGCRGTGAMVVSAQRSQSQHGTGEMCFIKSQLVGIVTPLSHGRGGGQGGGAGGTPARSVIQLPK